MRTMRFENLEDRLAMAVFGNPWPDTDNITISFVPDGTLVEGQASNLFARLDQSQSRVAWQRQILSAFQAWGQHIDVNFTLVDDDGAVFGSPGPVQGGSARGDIRIAAVPLSAQQIASASPFDLLGDWSGDVVINTNYVLNKGGGADDQFDLYTVMLQEAGHALGLPNSQDGASVMFTQYSGVRTGPTATDIVNIKNLYRTRSNDHFDLLASNQTRAAATKMNFIYDAEQLQGINPFLATQPWIADGDRTTTGDTDFYYFHLPTSLNDFSVELRASGLSLFQGRLTVMNSAGQVVKSVNASRPGEDLQLFVSGAQPGAKYFVRVDSTSHDGFGVGRYRLAIGKETTEALFPPVPTFLNDDKPDDDETSFETAVLLTPRANQVGVAWDYKYKASISYQSDYDLYQVTTPTNLPTGSAMVLSVSALEHGLLNPTLSVVDVVTGTTLPGEILRNDQGNFVLQIRTLAPGQVFTVRVQSQEFGNSNALGNYLLAVGYVTAPIGLGIVDQRTLTDASQFTSTFIASRTELRHFIVSAGVSDGNDEAVRMTIYDDNQQVVASVAVRSGETRSFSLRLGPGKYTVRYSARSLNSLALLDPLNVMIKSIVLDDPMGPRLIKPGNTPPPPPPPPPPPAPWVQDPELPPWINPNDPFADPWSGF